MPSPRSEHCSIAKKHTPHTIMAGTELYRCNGAPLVAASPSPHQTYAGLIFMLALLFLIGFVCTNGYGVWNYK